MIDKTTTIKKIKSIIDNKTDFIEIEPKTKSIVNILLKKLAIVGGVNEYNNTVEDLGLKSFGYKIIENG